MGGRVYFTSEEGVGSTFFLELPLKHGCVSKELGQKRDGQVNYSDLATRFPHNILVVEDDTTNQEVVDKLLKTLGYHCDIASCGAEAIQMLGDNTDNAYSIILMDIHMPDLDGMETTQCIRTKLSGDELPIIAMTAHAFEHDVKSFMTAGMNDHIPKPIIISQLVQVLEKHHRS